MNLMTRTLSASMLRNSEPDDMNFIRKHAKEQAEELKISLREAACRVFSKMPPVLTPPTLVWLLRMEDGGTKVSCKNNS
jgi:cobalamin biosynthesis Mg chelatase CobN